MRRTLFLLVLAPVLAACSGVPSVPGVDAAVLSEGGSGPRVLAVVAHPDDEIAFAGTLFKTATHLDGACDLLVLTHGDGGYKYSTLAERLYGLPLTDPEVGRSALPDIRRREQLEAARILGLRQVLFLGQTDHRFTRDPAEVLDPHAGVWDLALVRRTIERLLRRGDYDFVLTHLPVPRTHGHHKATTILTLRAARELPEDRRPVLLGAAPGSREEEAPEFDGLEGFPVTGVRSESGPFVFDREAKFGYRDRLDYQIVVNWAIAAHRSQGSYQKLMGRWSRETFLVYELSPGDAADRARGWFAQLAEPQFEARAYGEDGELPGGR